MKCSDASWIASQIRDGQAPPEIDIQQFQAHLKVCPPCRKFENLVNHCSESKPAQSREKLSLSAAKKAEISKKLK